jgi:hypothetical protein
MLSVIILTVIMLSVIMLSVIMLNVVASFLVFQNGWLSAGAYTIKLFTAVLVAVL